MPGPFPGMDPYLEDPIWWRGVHNEFISSARAALNRVLPEGFAANSDVRLYVVESQREIYPDVAIGRGCGTQSGSKTSSALASEPWTITAIPDEVRESFIEIVSLAPTRKVVAVIEVLSPTNKTPNSEGWRLYRQKQRELIGSDIDLLEIDLLRAGDHTIAAPLSRLQTKGRWNYLACLHRPMKRWEFQVWHATLDQPLPTIKLPLGGVGETVDLDLQAALNRTYDEGAYSRLIDYSKPPTGPLTADERNWIDDILHSRNSTPNGTNE